MVQKPHRAHAIWRGTDLRPRTFPQAPPSLDQPRKQQQPKGNSVNKRQTNKKFPASSDLSHLSPFQKSKVYVHRPWGGRTVIASYRLSLTNNRFSMTNNSKRNGRILPYLRCTIELLIFVQRAWMLPIFPRTVSQMEGHLYEITKFAWFVFTTLDVLANEGTFIYIYIH